MILRTFFVLVSLLLICVGSNGQMTDRLINKYPKETYFEIRPDILMFVERQGDTVCSLIFQPNRFSVQENTAYIGNDSIEPSKLIEIFNELVPLETRKGKMQDYGGLMIGNMYLTGIRWDNVQFNVKYGLRKSLGQAKSDSLSPTGLEPLFPFSKNGPDVASITWLDPKCKNSK